MTAIAWLPAKTNQLIDRTALALEASLGKRLVSASLVGTAMNPSRGDRARAPEILAIVSDADKLDLQAVARALHGPMTAGARVRVLTRRELERSCDVFALEISDWKHRHHLLFGEDVLTTLEVSREHLRHALETELRALSRRIRNRLLSGLATNAHRDDPREALLAGFDGFLVAAYHAIAMLGEEPPAEEVAIVTAIAQRLEVPAESFLRHLKILRSGEGKLDVLEAFGALVALLEPAIDWVDAHEVSP